MDFILSGVTSVLDSMSLLLSGFTWTRDLGEDLARISDYIQRANAFVPVATALTVLSLFITLNLLLIAYYWITRTLNLIRGAG